MCFGFGNGLLTNLNAFCGRGIQAQVRIHGIGLPELRERRMLSQIGDREHLSSPQNLIVGDLEVSFVKKLSSLAIRLLGPHDAPAQHPNKEVLPICVCSNQCCHACSLRLFKYSADFEDSSSYWAYLSSDSNSTPYLCRYSFIMAIRS